MTHHKNRCFIYVSVWLVVLSLTDQLIFISPMVRGMPAQQGLQHVGDICDWCGRHMWLIRLWLRTQPHSPTRPHSPGCLYILNNVGLEKPLHCSITVPLSLCESNIWLGQTIIGSYQWWGYGLFSTRSFVFKVFSQIFVSFVTERIIKPMPHKLSLRI